MEVYPTKPFKIKERETVLNYIYFLQDLAMYRFYKFKKILYNTDKNKSITNLYGIKTDLKAIQRFQTLLFP